MDVCSLYVPWVLPFSIAAINTNKWINKQKEKVSSEKGICSEKDLGCLKQESLLFLGCIFSMCSALSSSSLAPERVFSIKLGLTSSFSLSLSPSISWLSPLPAHVCGIHCPIHNCHLYLHPSSSRISNHLLDTSIWLSQTQHIPSWSCMIPSWPLFLPSLPSFIHISISTIDLPQPMVGWCLNKLIISWKCQKLKMRLLYPPYRASWLSVANLKCAQNILCQPTVGQNRLTKTCL